ncbi:MAG: tetratricopeptide repeat protein, partial [Nannocystaceae bacterium]
QRAKAREQAGDNEGAVADYSAATKLVPQAATGFDLVALLMSAGKHKQAADVLEQTIPLIRENDTHSQQQFVALREQVVSEASRSGKLELADRYMKMFPPGSGGDAWYTLHLRLAREQRRLGDFDGALARVDPLLGPNHADSLSATRRVQFTKFVAGIHKTRGSGYLTAGKVAEAESELREGLRLTPEDNGFKLMLALVLGGKGQVDNALKIAESVPEAARGHNEVVAVLESMKVHTLIKAGNLQAAELALARAQTASNEAPETHLAAAEILAATPVAGLSRKVQKLLKKKGTLRFPDNEVNRYGEALSEVSWARTQVKNQGDKYLFRGPNFNRDLAAFEQRIHQFYPFAVEFNEDATTVIELVGKTGGYDVKLRGPNDVSEDVFVGSGKKSNPVTLIVPGLVTIKYGKRTMTFVSEPYTKLTVEL